MKCGQEIRVRDINGANCIRFIAVCGDWFIVIAHPVHSYMNGCRLHGWKSVLRELVAITVPYKLSEKILVAESEVNGMYNSVPLTYPVSARQLANLLGVDIAEVRIELQDMIANQQD